jgi:hypothetical protein
MTQDEIIDMARQAGLMAPKGDQGPWLWGYRDVEAFAKLVAAKEREACAKACDELVIEFVGNSALTADQCARTIRARGQA